MSKTIKQKIILTLSNVKALPIGPPTNKKKLKMCNSTIDRNVINKKSELEIFLIIEQLML